MADAKVVLALDSGVLIEAEKDQRVEALIRTWLGRGARIMISAPSLSECIRGGPKDAVANRLIKAIDNTHDVDESIARSAGVRLGRTRSQSTIDALIVATAEHHAVTDILTTDPVDITRLVSSHVNVIAL